MRVLISPLILFISLVSFVSLFSGTAFACVSCVVRFDRLSLEHGLSQASVHSIVQDHKGFLWFATQDGLNRYDGYGFKVFRHNPDDPYSISNNHINTLYVDVRGILWIGTNGGGLNRFDANTARFIHYNHIDTGPNSLSDNKVLAIVESSAGDY
ncbi:MAG: hypothetical protein MJK04_03880, partial [Psychrosphaera sp.]|nr:hypothetical protein [Psychrosphaera sp.]